MDTTTAINTLEHALDHCPDEDMRTGKVFAALDYLKARASTKWPFDQFREALERCGSEGWEIEGRWQVLNASLKGIKIAFR